MFLVVLNEILLNHVFYIFFNYKQVKFTFLFLFLLSSAIGLNGNGAT